MREDGSDMNESPTPSPQPRPTAPAQTTTYVVPRRTIRLAMPDGWARAVLAAVEAVFIAWALLACAAVGAYATVASNPWMGKVQWESAFRLGSDLLGFAFGAPLHIGGVSYRAVPTLFLLIIIVLLRLLLRSGRGFPASALWFAVPAFATLSFLIVAGGAYTHWWQASAGALSLPFIASAWAYLDAKGGWKILSRGRKWLEEGLRQGAALICMAVLVSSVALVLTLLVHVDAMKALHALLLTDSASADALIVTVQALYTPTWIAWTLAWLAGPGVWIGVDALHSPTLTSTEPIPGIPVLGAVPNSTPGILIVLVPIVCAALLGVLFGRIRMREKLVDQLRTGAVALLFFAALILLWLPTSVLHLGLARMSTLGPDIVPVFFALLFEIPVVFFLAEVCVHSRFLDFWRQQWRISRLKPGKTEHDLSSVSAQSCALGDEECSGAEGGSADAEKMAHENVLGEEKTAPEKVCDAPAGSEEKHDTFDEDDEESAQEKN